MRCFSASCCAHGCWSLTLSVAICAFVKPASAAQDDLGLELKVEKPTMLQAFQGVDTTFVVTLKGRDVVGSKDAPSNPLRILEAAPFLEVRGADGTKKSWGQAPRGGVWQRVWTTNTNALGTFYAPIDADFLPAGELFYGINAVITPTNSIESKGAPHVSGFWKIDRAKFQPLDVAVTPRTPQMVLHSFKIFQINEGNIMGEAVFDLSGAAMNEQTPLDVSFAQLGGTSAIGSVGTSRGITMLTRETATRRVAGWTVYKALPGAARPQTVRLTGRASAGNRWPLGFEIETFEWGKMKVGQSLKFKQWPLNAPQL